MIKDSKKITKEELKNIKELNNKYTGILTEIGFLQVRQANLLGLSQEEAKKLEEVKKELEEKYGQVNINLEDGVYTEIEAEESKSE